MKMSRVLLVMAAVLIVISVLLIMGVGRVGAQELPRFQHSIFAPAGVVEHGDDGRYHFRAFTGAGYMTAWTVYDRGDLNVIGIGIPHVIAIDSELDKFSYAIGLNLNFGGNFGVGAGYQMVDTETQTGLALGQSSWKENGSLYFSFHIPLNGGGLVNAYK